MYVLQLTRVMAVIIIIVIQMYDRYIFLKTIVELTSLYYVEKNSVKIEYLERNDYFLFAYIIEKLFK